LKLDPGYYKISSGKRMDKSYHFLRVWIQDGEKYIQIDHGMPQVLEKDHELWFVQDYHLITTFSAHHPIDIRSPKVTFEFREGNESHRMEARNWDVVRRILEQFPRLKKALGGNENK